MQVGSQPTNGQDTFRTMGELEQLTIAGKIGNTCITKGTAYGRSQWIGRLLCLILGSVDWFVSCLVVR